MPTLVLHIQATKLAFKIDSDISLSSSRTLQPDHYIPGLRAKHFWQPDELEFSSALQSSFATVADEVLRCILH